jgi:hypothetical protein
MGREVSQLDLGLMLGLNLASVEVTKWEDEGASGPEAVALSYLSQGLPGFRGDLPEWSYQQTFHAKGTRGLQILTRYWWPSLVALRIVDCFRIIDRLRDAFLASGTILSAGTCSPSNSRYTARFVKHLAGFF